MTGDAVPRLFGTDGIRGIVGTDYTPTFVTEVASAFAQYLNSEGRVLIAWDFRTTSEAIADILAGVLSMDGVDAVKMGPMPTPCLQFNVKTLGTRGGLMVTASHNPTDYNGIKFTGPKGLEFPREVEAQIEAAIHYRRFPSVPWDRAARIHTDTAGVDRYLESIHRNVDRRSIAAWNPRVVLDSGNGTSAVTSPRLLRELGCRVTTLNANPDGHFSGRPSEPSEANLGDLKKAVVESGAALGVAHDGDSDRVAFVDELGHYLPGEITLALFARYALERHPGAAVVTSVTSTSCVSDVVAEKAGRLVVTRSGSLPVAEGIEQHQAVFGGEENGGYYWPTHQNARDGPMSSAKILELLARTGQPLSALVQALPHYIVSKTNVPLPRPLRESVIADVRSALAPRAERLLTIDGVKAFFPDGWILVRPSGTEPICRIFAESQNPQRATDLMAWGVELVRDLVERRTAEAAVSRLHQDPRA